MAGYEDQARHCLCGQQDLLSYEPCAEVGDSDIIRHLNATQGLGLWYRRNANFILESVSDWVERQWHGRVANSLPALSTAEAELIEVIEAVIVGDRIARLVDEMVRDVPKFLKCDNTAAVSIASCATGAWRTRRLKVRAAHLKWRLGSMGPEVPTRTRTDCGHWHQGLASG